MKLTLTSDPATDNGDDGFFMHVARQQLFESFIAETPDRAIFLLNPEGVIIDWNIGAARLFQYTIAEIQAQPACLLLRNGSISPILNQAFGLGDFVTEAWVCRKDKSVFLAEVSCKPIYHADEHRGYSLQVRDLFYEKKTENKQVKAPVAQYIQTDSLFQQLIEHSYSGVTLLDADLDIIYRSPSASRIAGYSNDSVTEMSFNNWVHPADQSNLRNILADLLASPGKSMNCDFRAWHFEGYYIHLECVLTNLLQHPAIGALVLDFRDVTAQKQREQLLEQAVKKLSAYQYALDESAIVAITDQRGVIQYINDKFCSISGYSRAELIGADHRTVNSGYHTKEFIRELWTTIAAGKVWRGDICNRTKDGKEYWVATTIVPFLNDRRKPYQYIAIRFDITTRKQAEQQLLEQARELELSHKRYSELFELSPLPKLVFDTVTLQFLDVNQAAVNHYGYSKEEFQSMTLRDIRPAADVALLENVVTNANRSKFLFQAGIFTHCKKNGEQIQVEVVSCSLEFQNRPARIALATDVTQRIKYLNAIEEQNKQLREISWIQSHLVRAPLSRIMGLVELFTSGNTTEEDMQDIFKFIGISAQELDSVIKAISYNAREIPKQ